MARPTCPSRGDVIWLNFDPQAGHEQHGHRPAVVLSHKEYNQKSGMVIVCPMTSRTDKPWPFLVKVDDSSAVIADQVKCVDWRARNARFKGKLPAHLLEQVTTIFCRIILNVSDR